MRKISLFDLIWIAIFLSLGVFLFIFLFRKDKYINIVVKITNDNVLYAENYPPNWFVNAFKKGMEEKDGSGRVKAEIKEVHWYDMEPTKRAAYLLLKIKATYNKRTRQYSYKGKPLLVGSPIKIQFEKILVNGLVTYIEGIKDPRKTKIITLETQLINYEDTFPNIRGVESYVAEAIKVGDKVKSYDGKPLIAITDKKVESAKRVVVNDGGNVFLRSDPLMKDVFLKLKVKAQEVNREYYLFDDLRIKIGLGVPVHLEDITVWPTVTKIISIAEEDADFE